MTRFRSALQPSVTAPLSMCLRAYYWIRLISETNSPIAVTPLFLTCSERSGMKRSGMNSSETHFRCRFAPGIILISEKFHAVAQVKQPLEQAPTIVVAALQDVVVGEPGTAGEEGSFAAGQTVDAGARVVARHQAVHASSMAPMVRAPSHLGADRMCILYLARVTLTPRADTDGLILGDGTEVKTAASSDGDRLFGDPCKGHFPHLLCALRR